MIHSEFIDVEEYLQAKGIDYDPPGSKNVGRNSIGIRCPFCGDTSNHLGIKLDTKQWFCWICGAGRNKGFLNLVMQLEGCSYRQAEEILKPFAHSDIGLLGTANRDEIRPLQGHFKLPFEATTEFLSTHRNYLEKRNFDPDFIYTKYQLRCVGPISKRWKLTLIAPVVYHRQMVSFLAADITRRQKKKYKNCPIEESLIPINQTLYNFDNATHTIIVVEGITDVWRIGDGAVALYTKHATRQQLKILSNFNRVFIMFDADAILNAEKLANDLAGFTETEIIELSEGDPADMKLDDVQHLRREIFGS
jgi:DNA primase